MASKASERIFNASETEDDFKKKVVDHAKTILGESTVKDLYKKSESEDDFINGVISNIDNPKQPETLESKYLEPYVYPTLKAAEDVVSTVALPIQYAAAPFGQAASAASNLIQGKPLEESPNPITEPVEYARKFGTASALTRTLPTGNMPIAQMLPETMAGDFLRKEFPKASDVARYISPNDLAAMGTDIALASKIPTPQVKISPSMSLETAADYVRSMAKNNKQLLELEASGKVYDLAKMVQQDPESYLHPFKPNKIYENIEGKISPTTASRDRSTGLLSKAMERQNKFIEELPRGEYSIPREEIQREALANLGEQGQLEAGQRTSAEGIISKNIEITPADEGKIAKIKAVNDAQSKLADINKLSQFDLSANPRKLAEKIRLESFIEKNIDPTTPDVPSYLEMIRLRNEEPAGYASQLRRLGNKLQEPLAPGEVSTDIGAKNLAGRAIEKAGRRAQEMVMSSGEVPWQDVAKYEDVNKQISGMLNMRDLMQGNFVADSAASSEFIPSGVTGKSGAVGYLAKAKNRFIKPLGQPIVSGAKNIAQVVKSKQPQAAMTTGLTQNVFKSPLPMQLVEYQIPRDSNQILQNKDVVIAKIAQMSDNPVMTDMFRDALEKHPEKLPKVLPALIMQFPDLFEPDDYNRVDNKILDPQMKQKALKDIENSKIMDIRTKAFKAKRLQEENIYESGN